MDVQIDIENIRSPNRKPNDSDQSVVLIEEACISTLNLHNFCIKIMYPEPAGGAEEKAWLCLVL